MNEMHFNTLQIKIANPDQNNGVDTSVKSKFGSLQIVSGECCIYKVPEFILKGNEEFYQPSVMSIGPVYYQDEKLETMQEVKRIYLNFFLEHPNNACPILEHFNNFVRVNEEEIRECYQHQISLNTDEFIEMIVLDATFLVYYIMCRSRTSFSPHNFTTPYLENKLQGLMPYLKKDLFQLHNQIPYFVLLGIFDIAFGNIHKPITFINATLEYISITGIPGKKAIDDVISSEKIKDSSTIKHLVDLQRMSCCLSLNQPLRNPPNTNQTVDSVSYTHKAWTWIRALLLCYRFCKCQHKRETNGTNHHLAYTAKQLKDTEVKFVASESENPLEITFADGKLKISKLELDDHTESFLRSMIYFEQCHYSEDSYFVDYIFFLDELVNTVEDVQVLVKSNIINNHLGSDEEVKNLFNNIGKHLNLSCTYYYYSNVSNIVNCYASTSWHRWMAILRRNYLNHPWVVLSVIAAFAIFVLTLLQTILAFIKK